MREALLDPDTLTAVEEGNFRASNSDMMPIKAKLSLLTRSTTYQSTLEATLAILFLQLACVAFLLQMQNYKIKMFHLVDPLRYTIPGTTTWFRFTCL